jgi:hypothetical protein
VVVRWHVNKICHSKMAAASAAGAIDRSRLPMIQG